MLLSRVVGGRSLEPRLRGVGDTGNVGVGVADLGARLGDATDALALAGVAVGSTKGFPVGSSGCPGRKVTGGFGVIPVDDEDAAPLAVGLDESGRCPAPPVTRLGGQPP